MPNTSFPGQDDAIWIPSGRATLAVPQAFGPRILWFGVADGTNLLYLADESKLQLGGEGYRFYGGHRLWIAPESPARSMQPDNDPVTVTEVGGAFTFRSNVDKFGVQKSLEIMPLGSETYSVVHTVTNHSAYDLELAAWALTMMKSGTTVHFPQPEFERHVDRLTPNRPLVTWGYTKLGDPRWTWGDELASLRQDSTLGPVKIGTFLIQGYAAAESDGHLLVKTFSVSPGEAHTDLGCNFETFTNEDMIEIETLSPLVKLAPGEALVHVETWRLYMDTTLSGTDAERAKQLAELAAAI
jgi:hypothetical protein